ncbi:hypothetical protein [Pseudomonas cremoricolorata]|uniref:Lipoprotein n=1 Tax=Pseudomonas cremoricolorata TaxID=157783 RepID=A0A089Y7R0_9PSED|nr:hypothetical protein [Pseudomonas cremoricolorata]AIR87893.1 lipoprotein [Pseudomonas cremoricolorata]
MNPWRALLALSFLLLGGCLVTFDEPLPGADSAPKGLLGQWRSQDAWGESLTLNISQDKAGAYTATTQAQGRAAQRHRFTVVQRGNRWYLSAPVPAAFGSGFTVAGFDLVGQRELVIYSLDVEQIRQAVAAGELKGHALEAVADDGPGMRIDSPIAQVQAYLDDSANTDLFVEAARFQRTGQ